MMQDSKGPQLQLSGHSCNTVLRITASWEYRPCASRSSHLSGKAERKKEKRLVPALSQSIFSLESPIYIYSNLIGWNRSIRFLWFLWLHRRLGSEYL
jgi:hypothetical protein